MLEVTSSFSDLFLSIIVCPLSVPHLTQPCPGTTYSGCHHMSVYRRVCSTLAGSLPSDSAESQDAVRARRERRSMYYQKSRILLSETQTPVPQTSRRLFLKKQKEVLLHYHSSLCLCASVALFVLIFVVPNPQCVVYILVCFCVIVICP